MQRKPNFRVSPASVLALIALFAALGGTGYAAATKIDGSSIKAKSIAGKKLKNRTIASGKVKNNTLTGKQVNEAKLGTVPSAVNAGSAANAALAANVDGRQRTYQRVTATPAANLAAALAAAPEVELFKVGALTVYGKCVRDNSAPVVHAIAFVKTSQDGAILNSMFAPLGGTPSFLTTGTPELNRIGTLASAPNNAAATNNWTNSELTAVTPDGHAFGAQLFAAAKQGVLPVGNGVYGDGDVCLFSGQLNQFN
jgi:hypothetical protein